MIQLPPERNGPRERTDFADVEPLSDSPKHLDLIYDVGMHQGEDSEFYLRKGFRVIAFEADPSLIAGCKKRLREFLLDRRLIIVEGAIVGSEAMRPGQKAVLFHKSREISTWGTVLGDWAQRNARSGASSEVIDVDAIDFSQAIREHGVPYFMKIDIEGCDTVCLKALGEFQERPTYLSIESDKTSLANVQREMDLLVKLGYVAFKAVEQSRLHLTQSPPFPAREGSFVPQRFEAGSSGLFGSELEGKWRSREEIIRQYRRIRVGYFLLGDYGIMHAMKFPGARWLRALTRRVLALYTRGAVPGWYDTHARHSSAEVSGRQDIDC